MARVKLFVILTILGFFLTFPKITFAATTHYMSPTGSDSNSGTQAAPWLTLSKANSSISPGDTVILESGIYKMPVTLKNGLNSGVSFSFSVSGIDFDHPTTYMADNGAHPIVTSTTETPVGIQIDANYVKLQGIWFGGTWDPYDGNFASGGTNAQCGNWLDTNDPPFNFGGNGTGIGIQIINNTFFGYSQVAAGHDWLYFEGNRSVLTGGGTLAHGIYESGNDNNFPSSNHDIIDNNIFIGKEITPTAAYVATCGSTPYVPGLGIQFYHSHKNAIVTRNFVTHHMANTDQGPKGTAYDSDFSFRSELIANNFWYKDGVETGFNSGTPGDGWWINPHLIYLNNVSGHRSNISGGAGTSTNRQGNDISNNYFSSNERNDIVPDSTTYFAPEGGITAGFGLTDSSLDTTIANLQNSFPIGPVNPNGVTVDSVYANIANIENNFAALKFNVPAVACSTGGSTACLYKTGKTWFNSGAVDMGPAVAAPSAPGDFWAAFRALNGTYPIREFDDNNNVMTPAYAQYPYSPSTAPTATPSPITINFKVKLQGLTKQGPNDIFTVNGVNVTGSSDANGVYSGTFIPSTLPTEIDIKDASHLRKKFTGTTFVAGANNVDYTNTPLIAGDFNNDNKFDITDIALMLSFYTQVSNSINSSNQIYDINGDGVFNAADIAIIFGNYTKFVTLGD